MDQAQQLIQAYRLGFNISAILTVLAILSAVFIFFKFDIRTIFSIRTGRAAKKTIEKMAMENAKTGRLRQDEILVTEGSAAHNAQSLSGGNIPPGTADEQTAPLGAAAAQTDVLAANCRDVPHQPPFASGVPATPVTAPIFPAPVAQPGFPFTITENVMIIHTNELI